jgi:hypothetical protein
VGRSAKFTLVLCVLVSLAAGGSAGAADTVTTTKACLLVTSPEIFAALGADPTLPPKTDAPDQCSYSAPGMYNYFDISVQNLALADGFARTASGAGTTVPVSGVGDQAFTNAAGTDLLVRSGKHVLRVTAFTAPTSATAMSTLANAALARLNRGGGGGASSSTSSSGWALRFAGAVKGASAGGTAACSPSSSLTVTKLTGFKLDRKKPKLTMTLQLAGVPSGGGNLPLSPSPRARTASITLSGAKGGVYRSTTEGTVTVNADGSGTLDAPLVQGTGTRKTTVTGNFGCSGESAI